MAIFETFSAELLINGTYTSIIRKQDAYLNYVFGSILIILSLLSTICNPIIFYYHYRLSSISALLFTILSVSDFLTNIICPFVVGYNLLKSQVDGIVTPATILEQVYTIYYITVVNTSNVLVCLLCITRYICMKNPFYHIKRKFLIIYIILYIVVVLNVSCYIVLSVDDPRWDSDTQYVHPYTSLAWILGYAIIVYYFLHFLIAAIISFCTVHLLFNAKQSNETCQAHHLKGSITILIMNFMNFVYPIYAVLYWTLYYTGQLPWFTVHVMEFIGAATIPFVMSAMNPVIVVMCSSRIKTMLRTWIEKLTKNQVHRCS